jgi:hypothetical protein
MHFYTIRNTSNDRAKVSLHRTASGFTPEPSIGGVRLRAGNQMNISEEHFERIRDLLFRLYETGVIEVLDCKTEEGAPDPVFMIPTEAPKGETNPHGVYLKPEELQDEKPIPAPIPVTPPAPMPPSPPEPPAPVEPEPAAPVTKVEVEKTNPEPLKSLDQGQHKSGKKKLM